MTTHKKCVVFWTGYSPCFSPGENDTGACFGAELCTRNVAERLAEFYDVHIFSLGNEISNEHKSVKYHNSLYYNTFQTKYTNITKRPIDVLIVSRYINFFAYCTANAKKIIFWSHDTTVQPFFDGRSFPSDGAYLTLNLLHNIHTYVTLSPAHYKFVLDWLGKVRPLTDEEKNKFKILGNGLDLTLFKDEKKESNEEESEESEKEMSSEEDNKSNDEENESSEKKDEKQNTTISRVPHKFVYYSDPVRGLKQALHCIQRLHAVHEDVTFDVYRELDQETMRVIEGMPYVKVHGKVSQAELFKKLKQCEYLMYPCCFFETYCMTALECQMAGVIPIVKGVGALIDTVGPRGICITTGNTEGEILDKIVSETLKLMEDVELQKTLRKAGREFAESQSYPHIVSQWKKLIEE
jgi:glycosyltransferase involved in cell wall biosynthesis